MSRFGLKEVCDVTFIDLTTNLPVLYMDTLKISDLDNKATTSYATGGRGNPRLLAWDFDRQLQLKIQDALVSLESLSMLAGNSATTGVQDLFYREVLTVVASGTAGQNEVTLTNTPVSGSFSLWTTLDGGKTQDTQITSAVVGTGTPVVVTFADTDAAVGAQVIAFYQYASASTAKSLSFTSDAFPGYYKVVGDTVVRDEVTGADSGFHFLIPKAKLDPNFTLTMRPDGNPSVLDFNLDVFKESQDTLMIQMIQA